MKIPLAEFRAFVGLAAAFVAKRDIVPILRHLVFRGNQIFTYDGGTSGAALTTPWDFGQGFTLLAERLTRLLTAMEGSTEMLHLTPGNGQVRATGGAFRADFASLKVEEFPFPTLPGKKTATAVSEDWGRLLGAAAFSVSQDETKPALRGLQVAGKWIRSSDNYRITRVRQSEPLEMFLPDIVASRLGSAITQVQRVAVTDHLVVLYLPEGAVFGQRLAVAFPNVDELFVRYGKALQADKTLVEIRAEDPQALATALRRVLLFTEGDLLSRLRVTLATDGVQIATPEGGQEQAVEVVPVLVRGAGAKSGRTFDINGKMFLEAWERCSRVFVAEAYDLPLYFQATDRSFEHLLMRLVR